MAPYLITEERLKVKTIKAHIMRRIIYFFSAVALVVALLVFWKSQDTSLATQPTVVQQLQIGSEHSSGSIAEAVIAASKAPSNEQRFITGLEDLPASLQDTEVDGGFEVDINGKLIVSHRIRQLFDYFLTAQGEEPLPVLLQRLRAYIHHTLSGDAAIEAEHLLDSYVGYLNDAASIDSSRIAAGQKIDPSQVREQKQQLAAIRASHFDEVANDAFFAEEEAYDRYTLARLELMTDNSLSLDERASRLAELENQLPPALQESLKEVTRYQNLQALTQQWQASDGDTGNLQQIRENVVGREAADRLAKLDQQRAEWQERADSWMTERERILSNSSISDMDKEKQINSLRAERFSPEEELRIKALEGSGFR